MFELEVFVLKLLAVDGLSTHAVSHSEITSLNHEGLDYTVETRAYGGILSAFNPIEICRCMSIPL